MNRSPIRQVRRHFTYFSRQRYPPIDITLTVLEARAFAMLVQNPGVYVDHRSLSRAVWPDNPPARPQSTYHLVALLRKKMPKAIETSPVMGQGWGFSNKNGWRVQPRDPVDLQPVRR